MNSILALLPLLVIVFAALEVLLLEVFLKKEDRSYLAYISLFFLVACGAICILFWNREYSYFDGLLILDNFALFLTFVLAVVTALVILLSIKYISLQDANYGEFYALLLLALSGMMIMVTHASSTCSYHTGICSFLVPS